MADFKQNNKDAKEYYETQQKIADVIKRQTADWKTFGDAQKTVAKNAKLIKEQSIEIAKLEKEGSVAAKAKAEDLKKERKYLVDLNKEMLKTSTLAKGIGKSIGGWGFGKLVQGGQQLLDIYNKMDGAARRAAIQTGMSVKRMDQFRGIAADSASELQLLGISSEKAGEMMSAYADETGRQLMLSQQSLVTMGNVAKRTGMAESEMAGLVGQMEAFGMGTQGSAEMIEGIADMSDKMGVNTQKVMKKVQQNLKLVNKLSFKGGVKGMAQMAAYSEKYKISMEEVAGFAEKVFRPEGAIDAAANLQVLGGGLAKLGDPFQLMFQARNSPKEFMKSIVEATDAVAVFNDESGEFEVSGLQLDRLREASEATGMSLDTLVATAKQSGKMNMFADALKVKGEDKEFLSSIADMDKKGSFIVDLKGDKRYLKDLSKGQQESLAQQISADKEASEERALKMQTTMERIKNILTSAFLKLLPYIKKLDDLFRGPLIQAAKWIWEAFKNKWVQVLALGLLGFAGIAKVLSPILGPVAWYLKGRMLSKGFDHGQKKSGWMKKLTGLFSGRGKDAVQQKMYKGGQFMPGGGRAPKGGAMGPASSIGKSAGKGAAGTSAMGQSAGANAKSFMKGAIGLLAISAALFIFAKALQEFEKLQDGWNTLFLAAGALGVLSLALYASSQALKQFGKNSWAGIAAMIALSAGVLGLGYATTLFAQGGFAGTMLMIVALAALTIAIAVLGALGMSGIGFIGVALILALSVAMIALGYSVKLIAEGIAIVVDAFTNMFTQLTMSNIGPMLLLGPAFIGIAAGLAILTIALLGFGLSWLIGGWAFEDMAESIAAMGNTDLSGLGNAVQAINNVDMNKLEALRDLAASLSMVSMLSGGVLKVDVGDLDVKGSIKLEGKGGAANTEWINQPSFVAELKNLIWKAMEDGRNGYGS